MTLGRRSLRRFLGHTLIVHVSPGPSLRGVLREVCRDHLVLGRARSLDDEADLAGDVVVAFPAPGVWIQLVEPEGVSK